VHAARRRCRAGRAHPCVGTRRERLRPDHLRPRYEEGALGMAVSDDEVSVARQVVGVHRGRLGTDALRPRREACAHVGLTPLTRPRIAVRVARRLPDLRDGTGSRVPGEDREVREAVLERVVLAPDEPAAVEAAVGLVVVRVREPPDAGDVARACVDPDDPGERGRVELGEVPAAVGRAHDRLHRDPARERDDRLRQRALPRGRCPRAAPAGGVPRRACAGAQNECRSDQSEAVHRSEDTPPQRPVPCCAWPSFRRPCST
jgi:hypothetical protein